MKYIQLCVVGTIVLVSNVSYGMEQSWKLEKQKTPEKRLEIIEQRAQQQCLAIMKLQNHYIKEAEMEISLLHNSLEICQMQLEEAQEEVAFLRTYIELSEYQNEKTKSVQQQSMNLKQFLDEIIQGMEEAP